MILRHMTAFEKSQHVDDRTTGFLLDYSYFKEYCKMIAINVTFKKMIVWWGQFDTQFFENSIF